VLLPQEGVDPSHVVGRLEPLAEALEEALLGACGNVVRRPGAAGQRLGLLDAADLLERHDLPLDAFERAWRIGLEPAQHFVRRQVARYRGFGPLEQDECPRPIGVVPDEFGYLVEAGAGILLGQKAPVDDLACQRIRDTAHDAPCVGVVASIGRRERIRGGIDVGLADGLSGRGGGQTRGHHEERQYRADHALSPHIEADASTLAKSLRSFNGQNVGAPPCRVKIARLCSPESAARRGAIQSGEG